MPHQTDTKGYYGIAGAMDIRKILAANLEQLQARHKDLQSTPSIERATAEMGEGKKISKSVIQQVQKGKTPFNLDDLQTLAELFGLDAWQLLVPQIDPEHPPVLTSVGPTEDEMYRRMKAAREALDAVIGNK
jgi:transcriptional regulator with XRE-family HTH domain